MSRSGETEITSISISKDHKTIVDTYNLSPTEIFRQGLGVELHNRGIPSFQSETNRKRAEAIKTEFKDIDLDETVLSLKFLLSSFERIRENLQK